MRITSPEFEDGKQIPTKHTCMGEDTNPSLIIEGVPKETVSLVLIMDDPDAPVGTWDHWIMWNIAPETTEIKEKSVPLNAVQGKNSWGMNRYGGPCPPSGTHRYFFKLFALDATLDLLPNSNKRELEYAMQQKILTQAQIIGTYKKAE